MTEQLQVLIVEDEKKIADTLKAGLTEHGYLVHIAYDGSLGLRLFESVRPDLVILDINLPGVSGYDLCRAMRAANAQLPIIMLTAMSALNDRIEGYDAGADDYVIKPFAFRELLAKIRVLFRRTHTHIAPDPQLLRADDLELNLDSKEVKRGDVPIQLTAKEFQLLEYLLRNKNRVVSRADIAVNVWEIDFDTNTNVIDVYINYLRNKVDKPFDHKLIHTQVGMGYVLKENS